MNTKSATLTGYAELMSKLDSFIRKYYINKIIRGTLYSIALVLGLFILFNVLEHYYYFSIPVRKLIFYSFIGTSLLSVGAWVLLPMLRYFKLGKQLSKQDAALIIGNHFSDVKDKLLNILQLHENLSDSSISTDLVLAGIEQKTKDIKPVAFRKAIDLSQNKKYLKYAAPPMLILFALLIASPAIITDSTSRIIHNNTHFEKPAPFTFKLLNDDLTTLQFKDYTLNVAIEGEVLPGEAYIEMDNFRYKLKQIDKTSFSYTFKDISTDQQFKLVADKVESKNYTIKVLPIPVIVDFQMRLNYPEYTQRKAETLKNTGNAIVPAGTKISWIFNTEHTDDLSMKWHAKKSAFKKTDNGQYRLGRKVYTDQSYSILLSNKYINDADSMSYNLTVIQDQAPSLNVEQFLDSTVLTMRYFAGQGSDDYGLTKLELHYIIKDQNGRQKSVVTKTVKKLTGRRMQFEYNLDVQQLKLEPGDQLDYYFELWDNDGVKGAKSTKSKVMTYRLPSKKELELQEDQNNEEIKKSLEKSMDELKKVQEELKRLQDKLLQEKKLNWQDKKQLEQLLQQREQLMQQIENAQEKFQENLQNQEDPSQELIEKQEKLQQMFEQMKNPEMEQLMQKIQDMLDELEKDDVLDMIEDIKMDDEELEKEMDRMMELFKTLEVEKEIEEMIEKLEELAEKQEELSKESMDESKDTDALKEKQEELSEEFEDLQKKMEQLEKKNEELERPKDLGEDPKKDMESIKDDMKNSEQQLDQKQNNKASKSQKNAAKKMKQMAADLGMQMQSGNMTQMQEDLEALRQLLENLVQLSFDQEALIASFNRAKLNTPHYVELVQKQFKIKDDFKMVDDSLQALSKRVIEIESFVMEKVTEINNNLKLSLDQLEERKKSAAANHQQRSMKNLNDLALMLSETLKQMQQAMAGNIPGSQSCEKPGDSPGNKGKDGNSPKDKMSGPQKSLNEAMKKMKERMKNGQEGTAEDFAKLARRQAAIRDALRRLNNKKKQQGKGSKELDKLIEEMNKIETELVNKRLSNETLKRQEDILTRLLKAENAERQREMDNKRKSQTAKQLKKQIPPALKEYLKKREAEIEQFHKVSPALKPFYKQLVEQYLRSVQAK